MSFSMYSSKHPFLRLFQHPQRYINTHTIETRMNEWTNRKSRSTAQMQFVQTLYRFHNALEQIPLSVWARHRRFLEVLIKFFGILIKKLPNNVQISRLLSFSRKNAYGAVAGWVEPNPALRYAFKASISWLVDRYIFPIADGILVFPVPENRLLTRIKGFFSLAK